MILTHMIDIDKMLKLTQAQGRKVKGQGQICNFVDKNRLYTMSQLFDIDDTYAHD